MRGCLNKNVQNQILEEDIELLRVIAHPIRLKIIIELIKNKTLNVTQLMKILDIPQSTTSQHLSKLKRNVLSTERKGIEVYYHIQNSKANKIVEMLQDTNCKNITNC
ncbi:transcriptional regulator [Bacillus thuringiensis]|uniref:ArsR/SmtB family transcription factor n=1 Tax=Bacillus thuringiensis TaxID=1428 RepID=UPI000BF5A1C9|nr:metalloregulator ArsR/SmtB family transcription factor [Bacillus thuringiensis]PFB77087.1 transcriptional regulator [Bacillus thuringiensis]